MEFFGQDRKHFLGNVAVLGLNILQDGNNAAGRISVSRQNLIYFLEINRSVHDKTSCFFVVPQ
jgi:hypothetical protein